MIARVAREAIPPFMPLLVRICQGSFFMRLPLKRFHQSKTLVDVERPLEQPGCRRQTPH